MRDRLTVARSALQTLVQVLKEPFSPVVRDAAIQRFEYTFEAVWKAAKAHLAELESVESSSPKSAVRACFAAGLLDDASARQALEMADDRNLTSHTYNEGLAENLYRKLPGYAALMDRWTASMAKKREEEGNPIPRSS